MPAVSFTRRSAAEAFQQKRSLALRESVQAVAVQAVADVQQNELMAMLGSSQPLQPAHASLGEAGQLSRAPRASERAALAAASQATAARAIGGRAEDVEGHGDLREMCTASYRKAQDTGRLLHPSETARRQRCRDERAARAGANRRSAQPEEERGGHGLEWRQLCHRSARDASTTRTSAAKVRAASLRRVDGRLDGLGPVDGGSARLEVLARAVLRCTTPGRSHRAALLDALSNFERGQHKVEVHGTRRVLRGGFLDKEQFCKALHNYVGVGVIVQQDCERLHCAAHARSQGQPLRSCLDHAAQLRSTPDDAVVSNEQLVGFVMELVGEPAAERAGGARLGGGCFDLAHEEGVRPHAESPEAMGCLLPRPDRHAHNARQLRASHRAGAAAGLPRDRLIQLLARRWRTPAGTFGGAVLQREALLSALSAFDGACAGEGDWEADSLRPCAHPQAKAPVMPRRWLAIERRGGLDREQFWAAMCMLVGNRSYRTSQEEWQWGFGAGGTSRDVDRAAASVVAAAEAGGVGRGDADALFDELLQQRSQGLRMPGSDLVAVTAVVDGILRWQAEALGQSNDQSCGTATAPTGTGRGDLLAQIARAGRTAVSLASLQGLLAAWANKSRVPQVWEFGVRVASQENWAPSFGCENLFAERVRRPWIGRGGFDWSGFTFKFPLPQRIAAIELRQCNWQASRAKQSVPFAAGRWRAQGSTLETPGNDSTWLTLAEGALDAPMSEWASDGAEAEPLQQFSLSAATSTTAFTHVRLLVRAMEGRGVLAPALAQCRFVPVEEVTNVAVLRPHRSAVPTGRLAECLEEADGLSGSGEGAADPMLGAGHGLLDIVSFRRAIRAFLGDSSGQFLDKATLVPAADRVGAPVSSGGGQRQRGGPPRFVRKKGLGSNFGFELEPEHAVATEVGHGLDVAMAPNTSDVEIDHLFHKLAGSAAHVHARAVAAAFLRVSDSAGAAFRPSSVSGRLALDVSSIRAQQRPRHEAAALLVSQLLHRGRSGAAARRDAAGAFGRKATIRGLTRAARRGGCVGTVVQDTADLEATLFEAFAPFVSCETDPYPLGQKKAELEARGALLQHNFNRDGAVLSLTLANFTRALR